MDINQEIEEKNHKYEQENPELMADIKEIISQKGNKWDVGIDGGNPNLTAMLLYEYASGIEKATEGKVNARFVIRKIESALEILRFGDFKKGIDDEVTYGKIPDGVGERKLSVTEEEYTKRVRIDSNFGAHAPTYLDDNGDFKCALVLFDDRQTLKDGTKLHGIDLTSLEDIRHTIYHELTHIMEKSKVETKDIQEQELVFSNGEEGSQFINYLESADENGLEYYFNSIENAKQKEAVLFSGISTIEINDKKSPNRIMRNQISEGATELISLLLMDVNGFPTQNRERYRVQQDIVRRVFQARGMTETLTDYLTSSNKVISYMEGIKIGEKDLLHASDEFVHLSNRIGQAVQDNISETPTYPKRKNAEFDVGPSLYEEGSDTINKDTMQKAFDILWQYPSDSEKLLVDMFFRQVIRDYYLPNPDEKKKVTRNEIMNMLGEAEEFGKEFRQVFPSRRKAPTPKPITDDKNIFEDDYR